MKKLCILLVVFAAALAIAQEVTPSTGMAIICPNDGTTGTTQYKLAKLTTSNPAACIVAAGSETSGIIGIVDSNAGTTGNAYVARTGKSKCLFDVTAVTAGDYVGVGTAGACRALGATRPTSGQIIGRALGSGAGGSTQYVLLAGNDLQGQPAIGTTSGTVTAGDDSRITGAVQSTSVGAANGVAPLGADSKVPAANLPAAGAGGGALPKMSSSTVGAGSNTYFAFSTANSATDASARQKSPMGGTIRNAICGAGVSQGSATGIYTLYVNGVSKGTVCTIANGATTGYQNGMSFTIAYEDNLSVNCTNSSASSSACSIIFGLSNTN